MAAVSESIVREYFELHGFLLRQHRKYIAPTRRENEDIDFFIQNPKPKTMTGGELPFILSEAELPFVHKAVVVVKGWHTETFSPAVLAHAPEIFRFVEERTLEQVVKAFGGDRDILRLLVVPALPQAASARKQSVQLLRAKGVDAVIPFCTMLEELLESVQVNRNYQKSDVLQVLRILKNYGFIRDPQLELFKTRRRRRS